MRAVAMIPTRIDSPTLHWCRRSRELRFGIGGDAGSSDFPVLHAEILMLYPSWDRAVACGGRMVAAELMVNRRPKSKIEPRER